MNSMQKKARLKKMNNDKLSILVIGLGSMGRRRIRCLEELGVKNIYGYDLRADRTSEVKSQHKITILDDLEVFIEIKNIRAVIICTPPDQHLEYMNWAFDNSIDMMIEASVIIQGLRNFLKKSENSQISICPSCTMNFHPAIKKIKEIIENGTLGKVSNVLHHSGHYLPYWHKYEHVSEYYVSTRETGGAREIVPFELTWLMNLIGMPKSVFCKHKKTILIDGAEGIDDTYNILLDYDDKMAVISVDVVSRQCTRTLEIVGSLGHLKWRWELDTVELYFDDENEAVLVSYDQSPSAPGYNQNISEQMYIEETNSFLKQLQREGTFPNTLKDDLQVLNLLECAERSQALSREVSI